MSGRFHSVYWLGGSPCSGKSSVAEALANSYNLEYYKCDDHFDRHLDEGKVRGLPVSSKLREVNHEYVFMRSHADNVQLAFDIFGEEFEMVLEDIASLRRPLLVEGCTLLPEKLAMLGVRTECVFYMVPVEEFFREKYRQRLWAYDRLQETSNPDKAFENWMKRDVEFARIVEDSARSRAFETMWVDGTKTLEETSQIVARHFRLSTKSEQIASLNADKPRE